MAKERKILRSVKLEGTNSDEEGDFLYYDVYEPIIGVHDIFNSRLSIKEQKWISPIFPDFDNLTKAENAEIYKREIRRIKNGVYFWNNGELNYVTGVHYAGMVHWKLKESESYYFKYSRTQRDIFYFMDLCVNDPKCVGGLVFSLKRLGKSEIMQLEMWVDALLSEHGKYTFQGLSNDEAELNFGKTHYANEHLHETLPVTMWNETAKVLKGKKDENRVVFSRLTTKESIVWKSVDGKSSTDNIEFAVKPTNLSGIQGSKLKRAALDEFASIKKVKDMTLSNWHSKAHAQCTQDSGSTVVGKMWLIATAENLESESLEEAQQLWDDSAPNSKDKNGFTPSGLKRMFIPFYLGGRGIEFMDEYGNPRIDKAIEFWENKMEGLSDRGKLLYSHQNPKTIDHVFSMERSGGLEADVIEMFKHLRKKIALTPQPKYKINRVNGELIIEKAEKREYEGQFTFEMFEDVEEHHIYRVGVDATSTAKNSTNKKDNGEESGKEKSKFALVVRKLTGDNQYVDVANYFIRPEKRYLSEKIALWICMRYNKYGNCRAYPERNASAGSTLTDLFEAEGQQRILIRQLKHHNTDKLLETKSSAYGIYIDGNNKDYRTSAMNKFYRLHGHKTRSVRLIDNLLLYGHKNSDLADADGVCVLSCGNFDPEKAIKIKKEIAPKRKRLEWVNGKMTEVWK